MSLASQNILASNKDENGIAWYQIEIIIFANQNYLGISSETWPETSELRYTDLIELRHPDDPLPTGSQSKMPDFSAGATPVPFELLAPSELQLVPIVKKLKASEGYQPLLHIAWRQPTLDPDKSIPVYLFEGVDQPASTRLATVTEQQQRASGQKQGSRFASVSVGNFTVDSSQYGQLLPVTETDVNTGPILNPLSGTLRLSVSRYLHVEADLNYRVPMLKEEVVPVDPMNVSFNSGGGIQMPTGFGDAQSVQTTIRKRQALQNFHLYETRRMRSKEIHYFDHPLFGIITRVIPYEFPKAEPDFDPASQAFTPGQGGNTSQ